MFRSSFLWSLLASYIVLILLSTGVVGVMVAHRVERDSLDGIETKLRGDAVLLRDLAEPAFQSNDRGLQPRILRLGHELNTRFTIIRADGVVLADSHKDPELLDNHRDRPEAMDARARGEGVATRFSDSVGRNMMYLALPVRLDDQLLGYVRASLPLSEVDERIAHLRRSVALAALIAAAAGITIAYLFARRTSAPIHRITAVAESIAAGRTSGRVSMTREDELGRLAEIFNSLSEQLRERLRSVNEERGKLAAVLSSMVEGVIAIDRGERVIHLNAVAGRILGADPDASLGRAIWEVTRIREVCEALARSNESATESSGEIQWPSGDRRVIEYHAAPLRTATDDLGGAVVVLHDVTRLRRLESVRSDFIANVSHELKTPLTAIRGFVETLIDDPEMPGDTQRRFLVRMRDQALRLSTLTADLLTLSRLEAGSAALERSPIHLSEVARRAVLALAPAADQKGLTIQTRLPERPVTVHGDPQALEVAIYNLLDNAIKYTPAGGSITLRLAAGDAEALVEVQDTGIGIEKQHQRRIFERFYRVDRARSRDLGGTGLGLSIVKHTAIAHGGRVAVESAPGIGSVFKLWVPLTSKGAGHPGAAGTGNEVRGTRDG